MLRIHRKGSVNGSRDLWWHLSYGNLNSRIFTVLPLTLPSIGCFDFDAGSARLSVALDVEPLNLWESVRHINTKKKWDIDVWKLTDSTHHISQFCPADVRVRRLEPSQKFKSWRAHADRRHMLPVHRLPRRREDRRASAAPSGNAGADPQPLQEYAEHEHDGDEVEGPLAAAMRAVEEAAQNEVGGRWDISDSGESGSEDEGGSDGHGNGDGDGDGDGSGVFRFVPVPGEAIPADYAHAAPGRQAHGRRRPRNGEEWRRVEVEGLGTFVLDELTQSIGCHCPVHSLCRINKLATKFPVGYFMAWLAAADTYPTKANHMAARFDRRPGGVVGYELRRAARIRAEGIPAMQGVCEWEGSRVVEPIDL